MTSRRNSGSKWTSFRRRSSRGRRRTSSTTLASPTAQTRSRRIKRRCGYAGVRAGEASHPGRTGRGSRRTARIRANGAVPKLNIGGLRSGAGIESAIKSMIELLV